MLPTSPARFVCGQPLFQEAQHPVTGLQSSVKRTLQRFLTSRPKTPDAAKPPPGDSSEHTPPPRNRSAVWLGAVGIRIWFRPHERGILFPNSRAWNEQSNA
ncbi:MAG: hypothetical protein GYB65_22485 [Chloroflexi bacterium]|nr:hypothetical protein [Chloroflexota bacterium]